MAPVISLKLPVASASGSLVTRMLDLAPTWQPKAWQKPQIGAAGPPLIVLREDRARRRERMMAEFLGGIPEKDARLVVAQWRERIVATARRLEDIAAFELVALHIAGFARHSELVFGAIVV